MVTIKSKFHSPYRVAIEQLVRNKWFWRHVVLASRQGYASDARWHTMCSYHITHVRHRTNVPFADVLIKVRCMCKLEVATNMRVSETPQKLYIAALTIPTIFVTAPTFQFSII
jgi:hypothetical protein